MTDQIGRLVWGAKPDVWLAAVVAASGLLEVMVRPDVLWPPLVVAVAFVLAATLVFRRRHPLLAVVVGFGLLACVDVSAWVWADRPFTAYAAVSVLVLLYSVFRWGRPVAAAIGLGIGVAEWAIAVAVDVTGAVDAFGGLGVLLLAASLGATLRFRQISVQQQIETVRAQERERLARELHDTVAHHVCGIAIQAQVAQVRVDASDLDGATEALDLIRTESSRTLAEMRAMVGSLRQEGDASPSSPGGVVDLRGLADSEGSGLRVEVRVDPDLGDLEPGVEAGLWRVAQESVTNARRHARSATRVTVRLDSADGMLRLNVSDDGEPASLRRSGTGFGLVGMSERMALMGGTLEAGPENDGGWRVLATVPLRVGSP